MDEVQQLREENRRLRAALVFYAYWEIGYTTTDSGWLADKVLRGQITPEVERQLAFYEENAEQAAREDEAKRAARRAASATFQRTHQPR